MSHLQYIIKHFPKRSQTVVTCIFNDVNRNILSALFDRNKYKEGLSVRMKKPEGKEYAETKICPEYFLTGGDGLAKDDISPGLQHIVIFCVRFLLRSILLPMDEDSLSKDKVMQLQSKVLTSINGMTALIQMAKRIQVKDTSTAPICSDNLECLSLQNSDLYRKAMIMFTYGIGKDPFPRFASHFIGSMETEAMFWTDHYFPPCHKRLL